MINSLFDELKQFQFDSDTASITTYLDSEKNKETNKESEKYVLLSIVSSVGKVIVIRNLLELEILRETMFNLFRWKRSLVSNSNVVSLTNVNQCNRYALPDISNTLGYSSRPAKILMSPSNTEKRARTVFEQGK